MQRSTRDILFIFMGLFLSLGTLWASKSAMETRLSRDVAYLNTLGRSADGEKSLTLSLESQFMADSARIKEMRRARLGFGDMSVALAMASHLKGGITRANVEKIVVLWKSSRLDGWSRIARSLGVRLERVVLQIESLRPRPAGKGVATSTAVEMPRPSGSVQRLVNGG
jgi:hypothetical protein